MKRAFGWLLLGFLTCWVVAVGFLAVTPAVDGDSSTAAQGGGAGLVLLMFCFALLKHLRGGRS
ncbi:hypothetical protein DKM44_13550 [Deinococcus irradiatisoli]|uniref:Uncharacterized protein n=1 Tax=Deinococcus irradiatisoli TaxID=2202254 RepID=A0A2Z3JGK5_9DEIO|nr:hypothetical protein [Deinococcus irradiatisoli]AWN24122.1 hypothetical protein DKM44_13550 [Deinococcus irradiatisoli]